MDMGGFFAGSIFTKLLMDKSGWNTAMAETKTQADGMAKGPLAGLSKAFGGVGTMAAGAGLAIAGAMAAAVKQTADYGDKLWELHLKTGVSVETLSGLKLAAEESGTSIEGIATGFKKLGMGMDDAQKGTGKAADAFRALKIDIKDGESGLRAMDDVMLDVADRFSKMDDGARKVALAVDLFGKSGMELIPFLNEGRDGIEKLTAKAKELGLVIDEETAAAGDKFNDTLTELKGAVQGVTMELGKALMPVFTVVAEKLVDLVSGVRKWLEQNPWLIESVKELAGQVFTLAENLIKLSANALMLISQLPDLLKELTGLDIKMTDLTAGGLPFLNFLLDGASDADKMGASVKLMAGDYSSLSTAMGLATGAGKTLWQTITDEATAVGLTHGKLGEYELGLRNLTGAKKIFMDITVDASGKLADMGAVAKEFGFKLKSEVQKEIKATEDALKLLKSQAGEATPGAIAVLSDKLDKLREYLQGVKQKALETLPPMQNLADAIKDVALEAGRAYIPIVDLGPALDIAKQRAKDFSLGGLFLIPEGFHAVDDAIGDTDTKLSDSETAWSNFAQTVGGKIGDILTEAVKLPKMIDDWVSTWPPVLSGLFKTTYEAFSAFVAELIAKWVTEFLIKNLVGATAEAAAKATKSLVGIGESVMKTTGDVAGAAAKTATGAISGVATSVVNTISGIVTAAASVLSLFKKADYSSITYWLKMIKDLNQEMHDVMVLNYLDMFENWNSVFESIRYCVYELHGRLVETRDAISYWGGTIIEALKGVTHLQSGGYVPRTTLAVVHAGETVLQAPSLVSMRFPGSAVPAGGQDIHIYFEGQEIDLGLKRGVRRAVVNLLPEMTKKEQVKLHFRAQRRF